MKHLDDQEMKRRHPESDLKRQQIRDLLKQGFNKTEISKKLNLPVHTVRYHAHDSVKRGNMVYNKRRRKAVKLAMIEICGGSCMGCGYNRQMCSLEFHHVLEKLFNISANGNNPSLVKMWAELEKVILLCRNCHTEVHQAGLNVDALYEKQLKIRNSLGKSKDEVYHYYRKKLWEMDFSSL